MLTFYSFRDVVRTSFDAYARREAWYTTLVGAPKYDNYYSSTGCNTGTAAHPQDEEETSYLRVREPGARADALGQYR